MAYRIVLFVSIFLCFSAKAQEFPEIDSLLIYAESIRYTDPPKADSIYAAALVKSQKEEYIQGIAVAYKGLGVAADLRGDYKTSIYNYEKSYDAFIKINDSIGAYKCRFNAGMIYRDQRLYEQARQSFSEAYTVFEIYNFSIGMVMCKMNLGITFFDEGEYEKALDIFLESKKITESIGHIDLNVYGNLGNAYYRVGQEDSARFYLEKSYAIGKERNNAWGAANYGITLGIIYFDHKEYESAIEILSEIQESSLKYGLTENIIKISKLLSECYAKSGNYEKAYHNLNTFISVKDSTQNADFLMELETKEEFIKNQKSQSEIALLKEQEKASKLENERKDMLNNGLIGGVLIVILIAALLYFQSKKRRQLNYILQDKNEQIEEQHKEIMDSLVYAKRIQYAVLPPENLVKTYLKESFVLYKPKDVVAGDFYWLEEKNGAILFAACDCTGHGVPGAMVSVICNNALNRSVREHGITNPGNILDKAREIVIKEFEKSEDEVKDGMDVSLCSIEGKKLKFAGANNPLWIVREGQLLEFKGDNQPVGKFENASPFNTHEIEIKSEDSIYIFSDGYVDQFGGDKGKKFKAKSLRELLLCIQSLSMDQQLMKLEEVFETWRGDLEQVDDVCMIGVKI